jgi:uncharacterized repeat protein (TIGR03803 family)
MQVIQKKNLCILLLFFAAASVLLTGQTFTTLHNFPAGSTDGSAPCCGLVQGLDGKFYGTTTAGGPVNNGTIFKISSAGALTAYPLKDSSIISNGSALLLATDGNFYGISNEGGQSGTVFRMTSTGSLTLLHDFQGPSGGDGQGPNYGLVQGRDGNFYGTTFEGGLNLCTYQGWCGTVFKVTPSGTLTIIHDFCPGSCADGGWPRAGLTLGIDGNFYGTTTTGGNGNGNGTFFKMTPSGELTTLYSFCSQANCADGLDSEATLVQGADGNFYGTNRAGGDITCKCGTIFKITPAGKLTTLHTFHTGDGVLYPFGLVRATDGNFYGGSRNGSDTSCGDSYGCGTIFKITPAGKLTILHKFEGTDGYHPVEIVQGTDGKFYGTTGDYVEGNYGTVFSLSVGLGPFVRTVPTAGKMGQLVRILGTDLTGATSVTFNGVRATFQIISPTEIVTHLPCDTTTGKVEVVTPKGTLSSNIPFQVL